MGTFETKWGLYYVSLDRTWGNSEFYDTYEQALDAKVEKFNGEWYILEQTWELED